MYLGAGIILANNRGQILLVCDSRSGRWGFPKGHPEHCDHKNPLNTALRECFEETGMEVVTDYLIDPNKPKKIGKRYYFSGICYRESFDKSLLDKREIKDIRWWSFDEFSSNEDILNSDLRSWIRKIKGPRNTCSSPAPAPSSTS
jgi:8-oxo-dGTP pyrophosphatase MutT (NUDIX family)